jgi:hypothetical protein
VSVPLWVADLASAYWELAGEPEPFPRRLRDHLLLTLPLELIELPRLTLGRILRWLHDRGSGLRLDEPDRRLYACLFARGGEGIIFLDSDDPEDEQIFSLAHEVAHFLRHYWSVRNRAAARVGFKILEVLDGARPPRPDERIDAALHGIPLGVHTHLLPRDVGQPPQRVVRAEFEADRLAWELVAPAGELRRRVEAAPGRDRYRTAAALLLTDFGLPVAQAGRYADILYPRPRGADTLVAGLRKMLGNVSNSDPRRGK